MNSLRALGVFLRRPEAMREQYWQGCDGDYGAFSCWTRKRDGGEGRRGGRREGGGRMTGGRTWQEALRNSCRLPKKAPFGRGQTARRGPGRPEEAGGLRRALWGFTHVTPPKIHPSGVSRTARGGSGLPWGPPGRARPNTRSGCSRALDGSI